MSLTEGNRRSLLACSIPLLLLVILPVALGQSDITVEYGSIDYADYTTTTWTSTVNCTATEILTLVAGSMQEGFTLNNVLYEVPPCEAPNLSFSCMSYVYYQNYTTVTCGTCDDISDDCDTNTFTDIWIWTLQYSGDGSNSPLVENVQYTPDNAYIVSLSLDVGNFTMNTLTNITTGYSSTQFATSIYSGAHFIKLDADTGETLWNQGTSLQTVYDILSVSPDWFVVIADGSYATFGDCYFPQVPQRSSAIIYVQSDGTCIKAVTIWSPDATISMYSSYLEQNYLVGTASFSNVASSFYVDDSQYYLNFAGEYSGVLVPMRLDFNGSFDVHLTWSTYFGSNTPFVGPLLCSTLQDSSTNSVYVVSSGNSTIFTQNNIYETDGYHGLIWTLDETCGTTKNMSFISEATNCRAASFGGFNFICNNIQIDYPIVSALYGVDLDGNTLWTAEQEHSYSYSELYNQNESMDFYFTYSSYNDEHLSAFLTHSQQNHSSITANPLQFSCTPTPSRTRTPSPTPSPTPTMSISITRTISVSAQVEASSTSSVSATPSQSPVAVESTSVDVWKYFSLILGIIAICAILVVLILAVIICMKLNSRQQAIDPYNYEMLSTDMFSDTEKI